MDVRARVLVGCLAATLALATAPAPGRAAVSANLLKNASFEEAAGADGVPAGWARYGGTGREQHLTLLETADTGRKALLLEDGDPATELGITQQVPATGGLTYQATVRVRAVEDASCAGAYVQLRFIPSGRFAQASLSAQSSHAFDTITVKGTAPEGTTAILLYLYTHRDPTPRLVLDSVELVSGVEPPPPPPPAPVPPQYTKLKELYLATALVKEGRPNATLVAPALYRQQALRIQQAIRAASGVLVPLLPDDVPQAAVPIVGNLIVLGNRSTNRCMEELYNRFYVLTDLRYPGPGGYELRSLHNPFGGEHNVLVAGGSDAAGVSAAAEALAAKIRQAGGKPGSLSLGWLMEIRLGKGITVPKDLKEFEIWEASRGYRSSGYFGWNSISKRMAMYYMTGDPVQAREAFRLAFPDKQAFDEITRLDGEQIENKDDPLAGPYHYNATMMILFWDLIEESPVFTDAERLRVTNAFARQLDHRKEEGIYGLTQAPSCVGSRHGQWSALSLYCLGRYFRKDYPNRIWDQCVEGARWAFAPLWEHAWVTGESDNLFWYSTATAPILTFLLLDGERRPVTNGVLSRLLRAQEMLLSGVTPDWALNSTALDYLHKAAYLTGDGRWLLYRDRCGVDTGVFRLGQSFWPDERLRPAQPADLAGKWSINYLPIPAWRNRGNGFKPEESFYFGSFRSAPDASGDFVLVDGFNGESRNPYHTLALLELRLKGATVLKGYRNQVMARADGMVEPRVPLNAALRYQDVVGQTAALVGEVPDAAYCNWRRTLAQRIGRYALIVDDLAFRTDSENIEVQTLWETNGGGWRSDLGAISVGAGAASASVPAIPAGWRAVRALDARVASEPATAEVCARLDSLGVVLLRATEAGPWMEMTFRLQEPFTGEVYADFLGYTDRGKCRLTLDGRPVGDEVDSCTAGVMPVRVPLGRRTLAAGEHRLRVLATGGRPDAEKCFVGLAGLALRPEGAPHPGATAGSAPLTCEIRSSDPMQPSAAGGVTTLQWLGAVKKGEHRVFFHLIAPTAQAVGVRCDRVADRAAVLSLGASGGAALAVAGDFRNTRADLAIIATDHLFGRGLTRAFAGTPLVTVNDPVDLDWEFGTGVVEVVAAKDTLLGLAVEPGSSLRLDGKPAQPTRVDGSIVYLAVPAGRHRIEGARRPAEGQAKVEACLAELRTEGTEGRARAASATAAALAAQLPPLPAAFTAHVGGKVTDMVSVPDGVGSLTCVAEGKTVHVLDAGGKEVRRMETDGPIRVLHWWPETRLLLAGCTDEKVIAFDTLGQRKWVFVSEMDPAVFRAAKQYWFKTAPGHEGIHGLSTGTLLDEGAVPGMQGRTQLFIGSACTLEILDEAGKLAKRIPVFWGTGALFQIVPGPNGTRNLLVGRSITDGAHLQIVNSKTLSVVGGGFHTVPAGATYVGGWACMNRSHLFYEEMEGKGERQVVSEINGTWNRVTVWKADGTALYDASFGPGAAIPARNMADLDVADLDGDGRKEILAATSGGLVVALDSRCRKAWARRVEGVPAVMQAVTPAPGATPQIVVGCTDGSVYLLDAKGNPTRRDKVAGAPVRIGIAQTPAGQSIVLATSKGEVKAFEVRP